MYLTLGGAGNLHRCQHICSSFAQVLNLIVAAACMQDVRGDFMHVSMGAYRFGISHSRMLEGAQRLVPFQAVQGSILKEPASKSSGDAQGNRA